ncbi:PHP domain-containing protein [Candidatus Woesearchaeota archaeon]|nr:PHP domain-containing protein [Candidatus Woesearchaeota archaeon]
MLKAELHTHINADPQHRKTINYSAFHLIDEVAKQQFKVLAITCHDWVYEDKSAEEYAKKKGILLIRGVERTIGGKHVLIYNLSNREAQKIHTFEELKQFKQNNSKIFVIAPHPFHWTPVCLRNKVLQHLDLFDAWEYSWFYTRWINPNRKMVRLATQFHKPIIGCSDVHRIENLGNTYTLIDAKPTIEDVFTGIRENKAKVVTKPLSWTKFAIIALHLLKAIAWETTRAHQ